METYQKKTARFRIDVKRIFLEIIEVVEEVMTKINHILIRYIIRNCVYMNK